MRHARQAAEQYRSAIIPTREHVVELSQQEYDSMLLGVYQLVAAKRSEVSAYRDYIDTVRDYWTARAELERALGAPLPIAAVSGETPPQAPSQAPPAPQGEHHHHPS
jgi:cobalt-zinc-cadmium efflux system outer membrane protein